MSTAAPPKPQFEGLNALRGVAALGVVLFHGAGILGVKLAPNGDLAVDFFLLLSGFVIAHAYEGKLTDGRMSLGKFVHVRLERFYPTYLLSLLIAALVIVGLFVAGDPAFPLWQPLAAMCQSASNIDQGSACNFDQAMSAACGGGSGRSCCRFR